MCFPASSAVRCDLSYQRQKAAKKNGWNVAVVINEVQVQNAQVVQEDAARDLLEGLQQLLT